MKQLNKGRNRSLLACSSIILAIGLTTRPSLAAETLSAETVEQVAKKVLELQAKAAEEKATAETKAAADKAQADADDKALRDKRGLFASLDLEYCATAIRNKDESSAATIVLAAQAVSAREGELVIARANLDQLVAQKVQDKDQEKKAKTDVEEALMKVDLAKADLQAAITYRLSTPAEMLKLPTDPVQRADAASRGLAGARSDMNRFTQAWDGDDNFPYRFFIGGNLGNKPKETLAQIKDRHEQLLDCAQRLYRLADGVIKRGSETEPLSTRDHQNNQTAESVKKAYVEIAQLDIYDRAQASIFVGPTFLLQPSGQFETGAETRFILDNGVGSLTRYGRSIVEFAYQSKTAITDDLQKTLGNQFGSDKGIFRFNAGASTELRGHYSFAVSAGLNAIPNESEGFLESLRERYTATILSRTFLTDGTYSRVSAGVAYDKSWRYYNKVPETTPPTDVTQADQREAYSRAIVDVEILLPPQFLASVATSGALRLGLDTPLSGNGPSEVRMSVLMYVDFNSFFKALNPLYAKKYP
ncbi:hypothetical protein [Nevskia ramosa]|uniref:hypothetical protein n=1 Tax=Nevskia ramosa TaxID=64002 RepID=UPI002353B307|nr:hypothetical protein [Nevskia ramosa]